MSALPIASAEAAQPLHLPVDGLAGDAASPAALGRMSRSLAKAGRSLTQKQRKKAVERMKAAVAAIHARDYQAATQQALEALKLDETSGLSWHILPSPARSPATWFRR